MAKTKQQPKRYDGKGYSFWADSCWNMVKCHGCGLENYALSVGSGICYACGYDANNEKQAADAPTPATKG